METASESFLLARQSNDKCRTFDMVQAVSTVNSKFRNCIFVVDNQVTMCEYLNMPWEHEDKTLDGVEIFKPGTLVQASLTEHMLIDAEKPVIDPNKWIKTDFYVAEYGTNPIVMVLDLDPLENYYQIALGEKKFWYPLKFISKPKIE